MSQNSRGTIRRMDITDTTQARFDLGIERFLAGLVKRGEGIPKEPDGFWVRPDLIQVSLPKARNLSLHEN